MKLLVTGATGFLGRYVVAAALRRGHEVKVISRSAELPEFGWRGHPDVEIVQGDLSAGRELTQSVAGADAVIHLAAAKNGDRQAQYAGTVTATESLLAAMAEAGVNRIVLTSSFSVYDYLSLPVGSLLTEDSPLEKEALKRDAYAYHKLEQERLVRGYRAGTGFGFTILRPGVIYGKDNLFSARLGIAAGPIWIRIGAKAELPLTYVENCAEAVVLAAESESARGQVLNVVDDDPPTQRQYASLLRKRLSRRPVIVPIAWRVMRFLAAGAAATNKMLGNRLKLPGLLVPARLHARCKPLRYNNERIKNVLKWHPRYSLTEALDRSLGSSVRDLTAVTSTERAVAGASASETGKPEVVA